MFVQPAGTDSRDIPQEVPPFIPLEMDAETNVESHGALMQLHHQVNDCESWLLHPHDLQRLGIRATQVALKDDESLQFEPCFFRRHPEKILHICYSNATEGGKRRRLNASDTLPENPFPHRRSFPTNPRPEFGTILQEAQNAKPDGDYLSSANINYHEDLYMWAAREREMDTRAQELWDYLEYFLDTTLKDESDPLADHSVRDLEKHERW